MHRILWMKGGALGDFIVGLPTLTALRHAWPGAEIEVVGPAPWLPLTGGWAQRLEPLDGPDWASLYGDGRGLPSRLTGVDLAVVLRPDPEGRLAVNLRRAGIDQVLVASPVPDGTCHAVDHNRRILDPLGISSEPLPRVRLASDRIGASDRNREPDPGVDPAGEVGRARGALVYLHPGSGGVRKRWPSIRFRELARTLRARGMHPVVVLGPVELEQGQRDFWLETGLELLISPSLEVLVEGLRGARLFVGNDSGVSHLAAAVGCPTLALFGPTDPSVWAPRGPRVRVLRAGPGAVEVGTSSQQVTHPAGPTDPAAGDDPLETLSVEEVLDAIDDPRAPGTA